MKKLAQIEYRIDEGAKKYIKEFGSPQDRVRYIS